MYSILLALTFVEGQLTTPWGSLGHYITNYLCKVCVAEQLPYSYLHLDENGHS